MLKHLFTFAFVAFTAQTSLAGNSYLIGDNKVQLAQTQSGYSIEYQLLEAQGQGDFSLKDSGRICYSADNTPNCFTSVMQRITGERDPQSGRVEFWQYGIDFVAPQGQGQTVQVLFTNIHGLAPDGNDDTDNITVIIPSFVGGSVNTQLGSYAEALFIAAKDKRTKIRARLVQGQAQDNQPQP